MKNIKAMDIRKYLKTSIVFFFFVETVKLNKFNIYKYLNYLLETLLQFKNRGKRHRKYCTVTLYLAILEVNFAKILNYIRM